MFLLKALLIASLVKILLKTNEPALCAGLYVAAGLILGLLFGRSFTFVIVGAVVSFCLAFLYFWLLNKYEEGWLFWGILIVGLLIGLV